MTDRFGGTQYAARRARRGLWARVRAARLDRDLERLPAAIREEMVEALDEAGTALVNAIVPQIPRRTGAARAGISKRLSRATLRLKVGVIGRPLNRQLFYMRILHGGRRAQTVVANRAWRRPAGPAPPSSRLRMFRTSYRMRIKAMAPQRFMFNPRTRDIRYTLAGRLTGYWDGVFGRLGS
jgi:hypothetical protein